MFTSRHPLFTAPHSQSNCKNLSSSLIPDPTAFKVKTRRRWQIQSLKLNPDTVTKKHRPLPHERQIFMMNQPSLNETLKDESVMYTVYLTDSYSACLTHPIKTSRLGLDAITRNDNHQQEERQNGGAVFSSLCKQTSFEWHETPLEFENWKKTRDREN